MSDCFGDVSNKLGEYSVIINLIYFYFIHPHKGKLITQLNKHTHSK